MNSELKHRRPKKTPENGRATNNINVGSKAKRGWKVRKVRIFFSLVLFAYLYKILSICREYYFGLSGSLRGGIMGESVDHKARWYTLRMHIKHRKQSMLKLNLELPPSANDLNRGIKGKGVVNLPQSSLEHILVKSMQNAMERQAALAQAGDWKEVHCKARDIAIPAQVLQPNYGSWYRPLAGQMNMKRIQFSEADIYQFIKQDFPTLLPLYKRTVDPDTRVLIWSVCVIYQYGGYFVGNTTRIIGSEVSESTAGTESTSPCADYGMVLLDQRSLSLLAASPRHPRLAMAINHFAAQEDDVSAVSFVDFFRKNLTLTDFHVKEDLTAMKHLSKGKGIGNVTISEADGIPKPVKTAKNPLSDKLRNAGCLPGWLCGRCLKLPSRGSYATCKWFCKSCLEEIVCDKKDTESMAKVTLEVTRYGPTTQSIPRIIHQTYFEDISTDRYLQLVRFQNTWKSAGWEYRFYDDTDVRNYIIEHFPLRVLDAYDSLLLGAFKADLFRCLVLMKEGGIYVDSDVVLDTNLDVFVTPNLSFFIPVDIVGNFAKPGSFCVWNGLMGSAPGHPIITRAAEMTLTNLLNRADSYDMERNVCHLSTRPSEIWKLRLLPVLTITGPCLLGIAMNNVLKRDPLTNFEPGWVIHADDTESIGDVLLLHASKADMGAFRFSDVDRGVIVASTNMEGMPSTDKDAFEPLIDRPNSATWEDMHYSKAERGVDIFGSEHVYVDMIVTNEVVYFQ